MSQKSPGVELRDANQTDLRLILAWLREDVNEDGVGGFYGNRGTISKAQIDGELRAAIDPGNDQPVGFLLGCHQSWNEIFILATRTEWQGRGVGTQLVQEYLRVAESKSSLGVWVQCEPWRSAGFWGHIGFTPVDRILAGGVVPKSERRMAVAFAGQARMTMKADIAKLRIRLSTQWSEAPLVDDFHTRVFLNETGWQLEEPYARCIPDPDVVLSAWIDGEQYFSDKVKRMKDCGGERRSPFVRLRCLRSDLSL